MSDALTTKLAEALRCYVTGDEFNERTENQLYNQAREALRLYDEATALPVQDLPPLPIEWRKVEDADGVEVPVFRAFQMRDYARAALAATPAPAPVAWLYTLEYGTSIADRKVSLEQLRYPFGVCGADYLRVNDDGTSYVRETPLYQTPKE